MVKKYIVRLTDEGRLTLRGVIKKLKGSSQKVRRAQILLKADTDGPGWIDDRIADAFDCTATACREGGRIGNRRIHWSRNSASNS